MASIVPIGVVPCMLSQEHMCLAHRKKFFSNYPWPITIPLSFTPFTSSRSLFPYRLSLLTARSWSVVEKSLFPITAPISSYLTRSKLLYFSDDDVTGFYSPIPGFSTRNVLIVPSTGEMFFVFTNKKRGKTFSQRTFYTPVNACPVYFFMRCKSIHSDWIARTTAE